MNKVTPFSLPRTSPAFLCIGNHDTLVEQTKKSLQELFCTQHGCGYCVSCRQIDDQQHHAMMWLMPEKGYTLSHLEPIAHTMSFALEENQRFFFIIQKADALTTACANSLLKSLEEPPAGYQFILLADRLEYILPTIRSRCIVYSNSSAHNSYKYQTFASFFLTTKYQDPFAFMQELEASNINERESLELLDYIITFWANRYKQTFTDPDLHKNQEFIHQINQLLHTALHKPPMPGSTKLFWKNIFLQLQTLGQYYA
ncbi:hypothetical protein Noda2021_08630 [Candidatus Dependentiae bacterium Noda2021]|nr:hypothetical protein Noda2021_08630 [Candidatus Dependentiae bacterium Noda2021]